MRPARAPVPARRPRQPTAPHPAAARCPTAALRAPACHGAHVGVARSSSTPPAATTSRRQRSGSPGAARSKVAGEDRLGLVAEAAEEGLDERSGVAPVALSGRDDGRRGLDPRAGIGRLNRKKRRRAHRRHRRRPPARQACSSRSDARRRGWSEAGYHSRLDGARAAASETRPRVDARASRPRLVDGADASLERDGRRSGASARISRRRNCS